MVVRLRLSPHRLTPSSRDKVYHIVAMNAPNGRDKAPLETLGVYDPIPRRIPVVPASQRSLLDEGKTPETKFVKRIEWDRERLEYWIGVGAQPTKRMAWLLEKENLIPPGRVFHGYKGPKKPQTATQPGPTPSTPADPPQPTSS